MMSRRYNIVIAGAGLAGLSAAYRLAADGHHVEVYERGSELSIASGAIFIRANGVRCIYRWGLKEMIKNRSSEIEKDQFRLAYTNEVLQLIDKQGYSNLRDLATDRKNLQEMFYEQACLSGAQVHFGLGIIDVEDGSATLSDGRVIEADLILLADGISSRLRHKVVDVKPIPMPTTHYPTEIRKEDMAANESTRSLIESEDSKHCILWAAQGGYVVCKYNPPTGIFCLMWSIQEVDNNNPRLWDEDGDICVARKKFGGMTPVFDALLNMSKSCSRWRLARLDPIDTWHRKRIVLLGDSAHAMMPNAAQGYSCILEDIDALSIVLANMDLESGISAWESLRKPRVERIQELSLFQYGVFNRGADLMVESRRASPDGDWTSDPATVEADGNAGFNTRPFLKWLFDYDTAAETRKMLEMVTLK